MKKLFTALTCASLLLGVAQAQEPTQAEPSKNERWYPQKSSSIELYGVIDIGYTYTSH
ncbi:MAG: hypothetical protein ACRCV6_05710 [Formosimonas sp.]